MERLPAALRAKDTNDAFAIQDRVAAARGPIGGWKVGIAEAGAVPTCAPIFTRDVFSSGTVLDAGGFPGLGLEIEFAFRLERDLPQISDDYSPADIAACFSFLPLIEVLGGRFAVPVDLSPVEALADRGRNGAVVVGEPVAAWQSLDFRRITVELLIDGVVRQSALDGHPAGDPVPLVAWLATHCRVRGLMLKPGAVVTTGALGGVSAAGHGMQIEARWGEWGSVAFALT